MRKEIFLLIYDIPRKKNTLRNRVHRKLVKSQINKLQDSIWTSKEPSLLLKLAKEIRDSGAKASVLKAEFLDG